MVCHALQFLGCRCAWRVACLTGMHDWFCRVGLLRLIEGYPVFPVVSASDRFALRPAFTPFQALVSIGWLYL